MAKRAVSVLLVAALSLAGLTFFVSTAAAQQVYLCQRGAQTPVYTDDPVKVKVPCRLFEERGRGSLSVAPYPVPEDREDVLALLRERTRRAEEEAALGESLIGEAKALVQSYGKAVEDRSRTMHVLKRTRSYAWIREVKKEKEDLLARAGGASLKAGDRKMIETLLAEIPP